MSHRQMFMDALEGKWASGYDRALAHIRVFLKDIDPDLVNQRLMLMSLYLRAAMSSREAALEGVMDELPHSIAVTLDDIVEREDKDLIEVYANLFVERDSQKGIIIGHKGERLQEVGARARQEIEKLVGKQVFLSMRVKVAKEWQRNAKELGRLGF
eukprot:gene11331-13850_t